jgi:hypothetical protein
MGGLGSLLEKIASQAGLVVDGGVVIAGHSKREDLKKKYGPLRLTSHRQYGDNVVDFFVYEQDADMSQQQESLKGPETGEDGDQSW